MRIKSILSLVLLVTTTCMTAKAYMGGGGGYIFEPGIGYKTETLKMTDLSQNLTQYKFTGPVGTLKLGILSPSGVSLALAGEYSSGKAILDPTVTENPSFTHTIAGFQLGVSALNAMKIYLGYAPYNQLEIDSNNSLQGFKLSGQTYQAGVMFYPFSHLGIGAQYNVNIYKNITGTQFTNSKDVDTYYNKIDAQDVSIMLSILF